MEKSQIINNFVLEKLNHIKSGDIVEIKETRVEKTVIESELIYDKLILYMSDNTSYSSSQVIKTDTKLIIKEMLDYYEIPKINYSVFFEDNNDCHNIYYLDSIKKLWRKVKKLFI